MGGIQGSMSTEVDAAAAAGPGAVPVVDIQNVCKSYQTALSAVDGVSFSVARDTFLCLLGPSGSGKTTLLRLIAGLETPDSGRVLIDGQDVTRIPAAQRRTNMVFQHHALFPHLNVRDNIAFGPRMRGVREREIDEQVQKALELVQLEGHTARRIQELSGGQRQRVAIARAIINRPTVLLLDEPLASLDLQLRGELQTELRRLQRSLGNPFISVTHDQDEAMALADRIAIINHGRVEQIGTPHEIFYHPSSLFVAKFIGRNNVLDGVICEREPSGHCSVDLGGIVLSCRANPALSVGQRVSLVLRHEAVRVLRSRSHATIGQVYSEGVVVDRVFLGARVRYVIRLRETIHLTAETPADAMDPNMLLQVGERTTVSWSIRDAPLFGEMEAAATS